MIPYFSSFFGLRGSTNALLREYKFHPKIFSMPYNENVRIRLIRRPSPPGTISRRWSNTRANGLSTIQYSSIHNKTSWSKSWWTCQLIDCVARRVDRNLIRLIVRILAQSKAMQQSQKSRSIKEVRTLSRGVSINALVLLTLLVAYLRMTKDCLNFVCWCITTPLLRFFLAWLARNDYVCMVHRRVLLVSKAQDSLDRTSMPLSWGSVASLWKTYKFASWSALAKTTSRPRCNLLLP